jgi:hypothetical protein
MREIKAFEIAFLTSGVLQLQVNGLSARALINVKSVFVTYITVLYFSYIYRREKINNRRNEN